MHNVPYVGHPGYQKTIASFKIQYYWPSMKKEVVDFIAICLECQKVKAKHKHPASFLQPLPIPEWKWEVVTMDFITKNLKKNKKHDSIMVVVDKCWHRDRPKVHSKSTPTSLNYWPFRKHLRSRCSLTRSSYGEVVG
jgi:hypothetical protein